MEVLIAKKYKIFKKLSQGAFGQIYEAFDINTGQPLAIKLEKKDEKHPQLIYEAKVCKQILHDSTVTDKGLPNVYYSGTQGDFNVMVMDLLGKNLQQLFQKCQGLFSIKTVLMVADQMFKRIEYIHSKGYVHRDIKPENFMMGSGPKKSKLYVIDFGLSKKYIKDKKHIPYAQGKGVNGTVRYISLNTHLGIEASRRDDLQSIIYVLSYFLYGKLPWQGISCPSRTEKYDKIMALKLEKRPQNFFQDLPSPVSQELGEILKHIRSLKFEEKPNYEMIRLRLRQCFKKEQLEFDYLYDWTLREEKESKFKRDDRHNKTSLMGSKHHHAEFIGKGKEVPDENVQLRKRKSMYDGTKLNPKPNNANTQNSAVKANEFHSHRRSGSVHFKGSNR